MSDSIPSPPPSLLPIGIQQELIPIEELPDGIWMNEESGEGYDKPRYTAERFAKQRPEDYRHCITLLATGEIGLLRIARLLRVHHQTVSAVRDREGIEIDIVKQKIRKNIRLAVELGSERLPEIIAELPKGQLTLQLAILLDKLRDLDGEPTARIQIDHTVRLTHEAVNAQMDQFPDAIDVETVPSPMGLGAGENQQKGDSLDAGEAGEDVGSESGPKGLK